MFHVTSEPLPMDSQLFRTIGEIVVIWSRIENGIAQDTQDMMKYPVARKLSETIPHAFNKRLELWRRCVRTLYRSIDTYQSYADGFADAVRKIARMRNHIIHGTWAIEPNEQGEHMVMNYRPNIDKTDSLWVSQKVLDDLLADVQMLDSVIMGFITTKMIHGHDGLLQLTPAPSLDHPAHPSPATFETPEPPPQSSEV